MKSSDKKNSNKNTQTPYNDFNDRFENTLISQLISNVSSFMKEDSIDQEVNESSNEETETIIHTEPEEVETTTPKTFTLDEYLKEIGIHEGKIPLDEWNAKTGMEVSIDDFSELEQLNQQLSENERVYIHQEQTEIEVKVIKQNRFYIHTFTKIETKNELYVIISRPKH